MNLPIKTKSVYPRTSSAFTLIELLVVISIIALLISILLPALDSARNTARLSICKSNLRQFVISGHAYANDHRESFTISKTGCSFVYWENAAGGGQAWGAYRLMRESYLGNASDAQSKALQCPSYSGVFNTSWPEDYSTALYRKGGAPEYYGYNGDYGVAVGSEPYADLKIADVTRASDLIYMTDALYDINHIAHLQGDQPVWQAAFLDGHAETIRDDGTIFNRLAAFPIGVWGKNIARAARRDLEIITGRVPQY